jgi:hypothetical protein
MGQMTAGSSRGDSILADQPHSHASELTLTSARLERAAGQDSDSAELAERLLRLSLELMPQMYSNEDFAFRLDGNCTESEWHLAPAGKSVRYAAIAALGLMRLSEAAQRAVLDGETCADLVGVLTARLAEITSLGDAAMICWAAAEAGHADLPRALARLAELDGLAVSHPIVDASWTVTALVAARRLADVEEHLARARSQLIGARGAVLYPHLAGRGGPWYRAHVGSFADQVYPVQALARLHGSGGDQPALAIANQIAAAICAAQGPAGQWPWHFDSRTGDMVEDFPVYTVHQHAMAPMALMDLAEAGGDDHLDAVCRGLQWLAHPPEIEESLILAVPPVIWRKVARNDRRKIVRGLRAASTRIRPAWRLSALDSIFPPGVVDHECRPYELGWLLMTWLS